MAAIPDLTANYREGDLLRDQQGDIFKFSHFEKTEMIFVEKGKFRMGSETNNQIEININDSYFIGKYPVTNKLYSQVMGYFMPENRNELAFLPSEFIGNYKPVTNVSWDDLMTDNGFILQANTEWNAQNFKSRNLKNALNFKLPSEAQWEYAALGGKQWEANWNLKYAGSNNMKDVAWYNANSNNQTMPVGLKEPNSLGIHDMSGNVWEWCENGDGEIPLAIPSNEEINQSIKNNLKKILRGSGWNDDETFGIKARSNSLPITRQSNVGFRLVLNNSQPPLNMDYIL